MFDGNPDLAALVWSELPFVPQRLPRALFYDEFCVVHTYPDGPIIERMKRSLSGHRRPPHHPCVFLRFARFLVMDVGQIMLAPGGFSQKRYFHLNAMNNFGLWTVCPGCVCVWGSAYLRCGDGWHLRAPSEDPEQQALRVWAAVWVFQRGDGRALLED